ncbi:MAG: hypothetical protein IJT96_06790 [Lachnospiraceae bacterium]|nr:hypothetical protein [Lachnospiraceae bacterium]
MKKCPLFIILILTMLIVSVPGAVISVQDMNFAYPAAAVMIQTVKNHQFERVIYPRGQGLPDRMMYHPDREVEEDAERSRSDDRVVEGKASAVSVNNKKNDIRIDKDITENISGEDSSSGNRIDARDSVSENGETVDEDMYNSDHDEDETANDVDDEGEDEASNDDATYDEASDDDELKEFTTVDDDYFTDACFIGDSRVKGLGLYSDLPAVNYGTVGMQLYRIFDKKVISTDMGKVTIPEMLAVEPKYGKIYMKFGLNEMGWGNDEMFANYYYGLIDYLKAVQPDAILYVMGLIHVTEGEEQRSSLYNNDAINKRNELLRQIAEDEHVYYLDLNEVFTDEYGRLATEDSFDGIHIKASAINKWVDYLKTHAIVK